MGIEGFFSQISKEHQITNLITKESRISCDTLILDFNAIIHNISDFVIQQIKNILKKYLIITNQGINIEFDELNNLNIKDQFTTFSPKNEIDVYNKFDELFTIEFTNKLIIDNIKKFIIYIIQNYVDDSLKLIYISIDGVPSKAKVIKQRGRGFIGKFVSLEKKKILKKHIKTLNIEPDSFNNIPYNVYKFHNYKISFNKSLIKPATEFMVNLTKSLKSKEFLKNIQSNGDIKLIIDDYRNRGEAEHKFMKYILDNNLTENVCINSPDGDIIVLLLQLKIKNLHIMRYNQQKSDLGQSFDKFIIEDININLLQKIIFEYIKEKNPKIDFENCIRDISMLYTFFGNDFVAKIESISVKNIQYLYDTYSNIYLTNKEYLIIKENKFKINFKFLTKLFEILSKKEDFHLKQNIIQNKYKNIDKLIKLVTKYSSFYLNKDVIDIIEFVERYNNSRLIDLVNTNFNITKLIEKKILKREHLNLEKIKLHEELSDIELLKKIKKDDSYLESSDIFSKLVDKKSGLIIVKKNYETLDSWYHKKNVETKDFFEKEIYKLEQLLEEYFHFNYELPLTSNISKYKSEFYKVFLRDPINEVCQNYLQMLVWIVDTYLNQEIRNNEYYKYHKTPFCEDIYKFLKSKKYNFNTKMSIGFLPSPLEHLLLVTPLDLNNLENHLNSLLGNAYSKTLIDNIIKTINTNINKIIIDDIFYKSGINIKCFDAKYINNCHVYNENQLFDKYDQFVTEFRKNITIESQEPISQIGGAKSMKYIMKISQFKDKYYETRNYKYKQIYKSYKRKLNRLI
jgi:5'-3' exonuclease